MKKTVCIDFDNTIHDMRAGYDGINPRGDVIKDAKWALKTLKEEDWTIIILTTRKEHKQVGRWMKRHGIPYDKITNIKVNAHMYIDDRGMRFENNWESIVRLLV